MHELQINQIELELQNEELQAAYEKLETSNEQYTELFHNAPVGYLVLNSSGLICRANQTFAHMMGRPLADILDKPLANYIPEQEKTIFLSRFKAFFKNPENFDLHLPLLSHTRVPFYVSLTGNMPLKGEESGQETKKIPKLFLAVKDITPQWLAEKQVEESRNFYQSILDSLTETIAVLDNQGTIVNVNESWRLFARLNGYADPNAGLGTNYPQVCEQCAETEAKEVAQAIRHILDGKRDYFETEYPCHSPDTQRWFTVRVSRLRIGSGGSSPQLVVSHENITRRKMIEQQFQTREEKLEHLNTVLTAIRSVDSLLLKETDRSALIQQCCNTLTETLGYYTAWIALWDEERQITDMAQSGFDTVFNTFVSQLKSGQLLLNGMKQLENQDFAAIANVLEECDGCPLANYYGSRSSFNALLKYRGKEYGIISVSLPEKLCHDLEEQNVFQQIANDIALALFRLQIEDRLVFQAQLLENVRESVIATDLQGNVTYWGKGAKALFQYTENEAKGKNVVQLIQTPEQDEQTNKHLKEVQDKGFWAGQKILKRKGDSSFFADIHIFLVKDPNGNTIGMIGIDRDITEKKNAEDALKKAQEELEARVETRTNELLEANKQLTNEIEQRKQAEEQLLINLHALNSSLNAIAFADLNGNITYANPSFLHMWGYDNEQEIIGRHPVEFWVETATASEIVQSAQNNKNWIGELTAKRKDGSTFDAQLTASMVTDNQGTPLCLMASFIDISARKKAQVEMRAYRDQLEAVLTSVPIPVFVKDREGRYLLCNPAFESFFQVNGEEYKGKTVFEAWPTRDAQLYHQKDMEVMHQDTVQTYEYELEVKWGEKKSVIFTKACFHDAEGKVIGLVGTLTDITGIKRTKEKIRKLNEELEHRVKERTKDLEAANKELEAFSYSISHDLRAPLRAIDGFSKFLMDDYKENLDAEGINFLDRIRQNSQRMANLIDDILTLSRVSRFELKKTKVNLSPLATQIVNDLNIAEPQRQVNITIQPDLWVWGDEHMLRLLVQNLLENSWKFTRERKDAHIHFGRNEGEIPTFFIKDNGAGFDMRYVDKLFTAFQRLHTTEEFEGTGIGLATVQRIVSRHN
ncbi:PAS domain S-box protein, partial [bacterium]|nr:PAS domain S-box protein [bacterium]